MEEGVLAPAPIWSDVKTFDGKPWRGKVDILSGGYPCQPFSCSGKRKGEDDPRHLWPSIKRIIGECEPPVLFFENVDGHVSKGFEEVRETLQEMGYRVEASILTSGELGASHRRKRIFILATMGVEPAERLWSLFWMDPLADGVGPGVGGGDKRRHREEGEALLEHQDEPDAPDQPRHRSETLVSVGGSTIGLFPPIPEDERWWEVLQAEPLLEPSLRDVADGFAPGVVERWFENRKDQVRLLGNGVVPACAAYALGILLHEMLGRPEVPEGAAINV
jgi:DNA (cytosine-5)-methyltransferase 1